MVELDHYATFDMFGNCKCLLNFLIGLLSSIYTIFVVLYDNIIRKWVDIYLNSDLLEYNIIYILCILNIHRSYTDYVHKIVAVFTNGIKLFCIFTH